MWLICLIWLFYVVLAFYKNCCYSFYIRIIRVLRHICCSTRIFCISYIFFIYLIWDYMSYNKNFIRQVFSLVFSVIYSGITCHRTKILYGKYFLLFLASFILELRVTGQKSYTTSIFLIFYYNLIENYVSYKSNDKWHVITCYKVLFFQ